MARKVAGGLEGWTSDKYGWTPDEAHIAVLKDVLAATLAGNIRRSETADVLIS